MHPIFALSVRTFIEDIGAYAGFASVVALALLALLLFAQARELKRLREWGAQAHERVGELERSVGAALELARRAQAQAQRGDAAAAGQRAAAAQAGAPARAGAPVRAVASTAAPTRPPLPPTAPANVGAPALASATVLIPLPGAPQRRTTVPAPPPAATAAPPAVPAAAPAGGGRPVPAAAAATAAAGARVGAPEPPPTTEQTTVNGRVDQPSEEGQPVPPRRVASAPARPARAGALAPDRTGATAGGRSARPVSRPRTGGRPQPAAPLRAGGASTRALPADAPPRGRRRLVGVLLVVFALVVVAAGAYLVLGGGDDTPRSVRVQTPAGQGGAARRASSTRTTPVVSPSETTVAVLNGTGVTGLANSTMQELVAHGFGEGTVTDASDTGRTATVVEYRNGQEAAARAVAEALSLTPDTVMPIRADSETVACAGTTPCTIDVVVTIGADRVPG